MVKMQDIYDTSLQAVQSGYPCTVDFKRGTLRIDGVALVENGVVYGGFTLPQGDTVEIMENLYDRYRHSVPGARSGGRKAYFSALSLDELTEEDMMYGERRETARAALEMFILFSLIAGTLSWEMLEPDERRFFWQSSKHPEFIILKKWFTNA